jgi:DNA-binding transcriptional MerR regulator
LSLKLPDKQTFKIGEVAAIVGVKPSVLRFWETQFGFLRPQKTRSNQRLYSRRMVERLGTLKTLLYERGFTIAGARRYLARGGRADDAVLEQVKKELRELLQLVGE